MVINMTKTNYNYDLNWTHWTQNKPWHLTFDNPGTGLGQKHGTVIKPVNTFPMWN
jgi:hypothetical protein